MKSWTQREAHIDLVLDQCRGRAADRDWPALEDFIRSFYRKGAPEDVIARPPEMLCAIALSLWDFAAEREPGRLRLRVFNPNLQDHGWLSSHTAVQMVNDDMPFLVDSVTNHFTQSGIEVHFVCHPVMRMVRDAEGRRQDAMAGNGDAGIRESLIHMEIDRKSAPEMLDRIAAEITAILADVRTAVSDWQAMIEAVRAAAAELQKASAATAASADRMAEAQVFLEWLAENRFTFLGYRRYSHRPEEGVAEIGLGLLRDPARQVFREGQRMVAMGPEVRDFMAGPEPLIVTKANQRSTVHRPVHLDYVGVKRYDPTGEVVGEHRFIGLFTSVALNRRVQNIPFLRRKVERVMELAGFAPMSHDGRALLHILETFPRDELFQMDEGRLFETAIGVMHLRERPHARAFLRPDKFGRFVSALVYVPRDLFESGLRSRIEAILCKAYDGAISARYAQLSDDVLARWHFIARLTPGHVPTVDPDEINARIAEVARGWRDHLKEIAIARWGEERGLLLLERYVGGFTPAYRDIFTPEVAVDDIEKLEAAAGVDPATGGNQVQHHFYRLPDDADATLRLKIYHPTKVIPLSDVMPILENLGLRVIEEIAYEVPYGDLDRPPACIHDFYLTEPRGAEIALAEVKPRLEALLARVAAGTIESDGHNALVLRAGLDWREVEILRAYGKYLRQLGLSYSEEYLRTSLADHPAIARLLIELFTARFDPALDTADRTPQAARILRQIQDALTKVASPDQDAILRAFRNAIQATLRCNAYQHDGDGGFKPAIALKIRSRDLKEAPLPRPFAEIFVYAPRVEGVHLRLGPVARGGVRWSDRPEDFRTEVLGLVKAQQVKNAVIVPEGAKGGFYPKRLPRTAARDAILAEAVASYEIFIGALLDVTDNIVGGTIIPPPDLVRHDDDDPYLVVAADKGTASLSDHANAIAEAREFWLGDAFASGGSHGYDHKGMAITARGAWISVERHFRERGIDLAEAEISVAGIGDMSGDVFGNGMLRSNRIRLKAAFDHRHIFIDPDPDPARSFAERQRLFALPRSSWADYDGSLISPGGGIFPRDAKMITLTPEMREVLDVEDPELTPNQVIRAILKAPLDLLWIGGIGTFVKGPGESDRDVGDRSNDAVRVNGNELRCRVVGEGGNLGFTQLGRIAYARGGGAINTDATDNSAGVDCSDREVNIKILLNALMREGALTFNDRNQLLGEMTEDVATLVLRDNYLQTLSITLECAASANNIGIHGRLITYLEGLGHLDRTLEFLPSTEDLAERGARREGLTRPELAILMSYTKMALKRAILAGTLADDPDLADDLAAAFPPQIAARYPNEVKRHPLRREIIATAVANELVNHLGASFILPVIEQTGAGLAAIARAFVAVRDLFHLRDLWAQVDALDNKVAAAVQTELYGDIITFTRRFVIWTLRRHGDAERIAEIVAPLRAGIDALIATPLAILGDFQVTLVQEKMNAYLADGVPEALAARIAALAQHAPSGDVVEVAAAVGRSVEDVGAAYYHLGNVTGLNWLKSAAADLPAADHWDRLAAAAMIDDLLEVQRMLADAVLAAAPRERDGLGAAEDWAAANPMTLQHLQELLTDLKGGALSYAKLGYASRHARRLLSLAR